MLMKEKEIEGIENVRDLRAALADVPDDMEIGDYFGDALSVTLSQNPETNQPYIYFR